MMRRTTPTTNRTVQRQRRDQVDHIQLKALSHIPAPNRRLDLQMVAIYHCRILRSRLSLSVKM